jgi:acetoin utilization deacetylase AcuC-like enzyme
VTIVTVLFSTHPAYLDHIAGPAHPERPARLGAVLDGSREAGIADGLVALEPREATRAELELVHPAEHLDRISAMCAAGGGRIDADTTVSSGSWRATVLAAGAGLAAIEALDRGDHGATAAFCAVRPPGHHATPDRSMGFCIVSNVAIAAATLAARGERVMIVDYDAHHGNGTQDAFYRDPRVLYVSFHQWPLYPGTGSVREIGDGDGMGTTLNIPMPPFSTGDRYLEAIDGVVSQVARRFAPTWLIISAGFDAHRDDPITDLGLSAGDYHLITERLLQFAPPGRRLVMLEGGYDLDALRNGSAAALSALMGRVHQPEPPTSGGPGDHVASGVHEFWAEHGLL